MLPIADNVPSRTPPIATQTIIVINVLVFGLLLGLPQEQLERVFYVFGVVPARYTHPEWAQWFGLPVDNFWPFFTSMFLHAGWFHLISNMWVLWIFGDNVEERMGPVRFTLFYLTCGILAGIAHFLTNPGSTVPTVGASGAIAGVLGAYFVLFPLARIVAMVPIFFWPFFVEVPAFFYLAVWFGSQFLTGTLSLVGPQQGGGIAWWAHIGGFVAGMLLYRLFMIRRSRPRSYAPDEAAYEAAWGRSRGGPAYPY